MAWLSYDKVRMETSLCILKCFCGSDMMIIYNSSQTHNPDQSWSLTTFLPLCRRAEWRLRQGVCCVCLVSQVFWRESGVSRRPGAVWQIVTGLTALVTLPARSTRWLGLERRDLRDLRHLRVGSPEWAIPPSLARGHDTGMDGERGVRRRYEGEVSLQHPLCHHPCHWQLSPAPGTGQVTSFPAACDGDAGLVTPGHTSSTWKTRRQACVEKS